jgi:hypothetical protein
MKTLLLLTTAAFITISGLLACTAITTGMRQRQLMRVAATPVDDEQIRDRFALHAERGIAGRVA